MSKIQVMDKFALVRNQAFDEVQLMKEATARAKAVRRQELQDQKLSQQRERERVAQEKRAPLIAKFYKLDARDGSLSKKRPGPPKNHYRELVNVIKTAAVCTDCERDWEPVALGFDHLPERGPKLFSISQGSNKSTTELMAEIAKCEVVCHSCHAIRTNKRIKAKKAA